MVGALAYNTVLELSRDEQRRIIIAALANKQEPVSVSELSTIIVTHTHHTDRTDDRSDAIKQVQIRLIHVHLPKLEEAGLITYDRSSQTVDTTESFDHWCPQLLTIIEGDPQFESLVEV